MERTDIRDEFVGNALVQCPHCGHLQVMELPDDEVLGAYYAERYSARRGAEVTARYLDVMTRRAEAQLDLVATACRIDGAALIDAGCGYGSLLQAAKRRGASTSGIEMDPRAAEYCLRIGLSVRRIHSEVELRSLTETAGPQVVVLSHVLEHLRDPAAYLQCCGGSLVLIEVPAYRLAIREQFFDQEGHLNFFCRRSLESLMSRLGFECMVLEQYGPPADLYWRASHVWRRRVRRLVSRDHFMGLYDTRCADGIWLRALARRA